VNRAAINMGVQVFLLYIDLYSFPIVVWQGYKVDLVLVFIGAAILISIVVALFCISTNIV
jgi:hypothetical protein